MNKIVIENETKDKDLYLKENAIVIIKASSSKIKYFIENEVKVFTLIEDSKIELNYNIKHNASINIFNENSSLNVNIDILKDKIDLKYAYSTINKDENSYEININHIGKSIISNIVNHGINVLDNKLSFVINTIVPKDSLNIKTSQDSKIIVLKDNTAVIKPNLIIDNDDIEANHAAYTGRFKEDEIFYLMTRGLERDDAINLLVKSFLIGNMDISFRERELILEIINNNWR